MHIELLMEQVLGAVLLVCSVYTNVRGTAVQGVQDAINEQLDDGHSVDLKTVRIISPK